MMVDIYNVEIKESYLKQFENQKTYEVYSRIFKLSFELESKLNKDLYNFNDVEISEFLKDYLKPKTKQSSRSYFSVLSNYIQWAIDNPDVTDARSLTNPMKRRQEFFYEFVQETKLYFNIHEKESLMRGLRNTQDAFIVDALWEGIQGTKLSELVNLRIDDVNEKELSITLRDDEGNKVRDITFENCEWIDDITIFDNAKLANKEIEYYKANGTIDYSNTIKDTVLLTKSDYVLKSAPTNSKDNEQGGQKVSYYTVYNRLEMIRNLEKFSEYKDALPSKNIVRSGMIYMALQLFKRDRELGRKQIEEVCKRYNMSYKWSLKDFLNVEMLEELYPVEMSEIEYDKKPQQV